MITNNQAQLTTILNRLDIQELSIRSGFSSRKSRKISIEHLIQGFFAMAGTSHFSLRQWAFNISSLSQNLVSFQAVAKRLDFRQESFFHGLLQKALMYKIHQRLNLPLQQIFSSFNRVLIQDSTCFKLPQSLFEFFPGPRLPHGRKAGGRIQLCMNLKDHTFQSVELQSYCQNDASYASHIINFLQPGDLIIRDLGYWSIPVLKEITNKMASFLMRLNLGKNLHCPLTKESLDLAKLLRKQDRSSIKILDLPVLIGDDHLLPVRLVAIKSNAEQTRQRIQNAFRQRHKNTPISNKAKYLMSWSLYITNVSREDWAPISVMNAYQIRWHIEMIFKNWKSQFNLTSFFKNCNGHNPVKPIIILLLLMTWVILQFVKSFNQYFEIIYEKFKRPLSFMRFAAIISVHPEIIAEKVDPFILKLLAYHSCYDKRKDRLNHFEKIYMNFLS